MSFSWPHFVSLADELARRTDEAAHRSAVSRAYYGAYLVARDQYPNPQRYSATEGSHTQLVAALRQSRERAKINIGNKLDELRRERTHADYNGDKPVSQSMARLAVERARTLLSLLGTA